MAWWVRLIVTLVLAPLLWRIAGVYVESQQGGVPADLLVQSVPLLGKLYLTYTLPATAVLLAILLPLGRMFRKLGLDLLMVAVAPLVACAAPLLLGKVLPEVAGTGVSGLLGLAFAYGLTWALTIREPATSKGVETHAKDGAVADERR